MIGDSITDCGRSRPIGEGAGLGNGYVSHVEALLTVQDPSLRLRVINVGTSGNTVRDLDERWQTDVLDQKPDWMSIMIGTNDVWRQFDSPKQGGGVDLDEYRTTLTRLVDQTLPLIKGMILMTPFYIEPLQTDAMRARMDEYGQSVKSLAKAKSLPVVDTQEAFNKLLAHCYSAEIAWDRVHPNQIGHMAIAQAFMTAVSAQL